MKTDVVMRIAVRLVERGAAGPAAEAFAGDLLESFAAGRSRWWCLADALLRVFYSAELRGRALLAPIFYCMAFVLLHPLWQRLYAPSIENLLMRYRSAAMWPGSAVLEVATGLLPAIFFVWVGVFFYLILRRETLQRIEATRILLSLSIGCCLVSVETILRLKAIRPDLHMLSDAGFYYPFLRGHFSVLLFLGLFAAIATLPRKRRVGSRRRNARGIFARYGMRRVLRCLGFMALLVPQMAAQTVEHQSVRPQAEAAKRLVQLVESFDGSDWKAFHTMYVASFVDAPPDVQLERKFFRQRTEGVDLRKLEEDTPTHAVLLVQEHNSDQFARIRVDVEPEEPHRIVHLEMGPIARPAEYPYGTLTDAEVESEARRRLHALAAEGQFAGVMMIQHDGRTVYSDVIGEADRTRHIANTMNTRFRIGSMNKMFTAVATLQLIVAGKLELDAPIGRYLPDYPNKEAAAKVTVRHLLTHTGGTGDFFGTEFDAHRLTLRTHEDFVAMFGARSLRFEPGTRYEYSNFGFLLLGAIIDRVSGQNYYDYVRDHVYVPAGMDSTGSEPEDVVVPRRAVGYTQYDDKPWGPSDAYLPYRGASAGGGYTTAGDLLRFSKALQQHKLLDAKSTQLLLTPYNARGIDEFYGFGFQVDRQPSGVCFGHSGGAQGQAAQLEVCPQAGYTIVWLANVDPPGAYVVTDYLLHRLQQK